MYPPSLHIFSTTLTISSSIRNHALPLPPACGIFFLGAPGVAADYVHHHTLRVLGTEPRTTRGIVVAERWAPCCTRCGRTSFKEHHHPVFRRLVKEPRLGGRGEICLLLRRSNVCTPYLPYSSMINDRPTESCSANLAQLRHFLTRLCSLHILTRRSGVRETLPSPAASGLPL